MVPEDEKSLKMLGGRHVQLLVGVIDRMCVFKPECACFGHTKNSSEGNFACGYAYRGNRVCRSVYRGFFVKISMI